MLHDLTQRVDHMQAIMVQNKADMMEDSRQNTGKTLDFRVLDILTDGEYSEMTEDFANRLKALRKSKNLSQSDLATMVGVHYNHIGRYERGSSKPSAKALNALAHALGVSTDYLMEGATQEAAKADFSDRDLLRLFKEIESFDKEDKDVIKKLIEAFITKKQLQKLAG
jgi:transcriptional regulator with XRE-family HTH domain